MMVGSPRTVKSVPLWRPKPVKERFRAIVEKIINKRPRLDRFFNIYRGLWTGVRHIFVIPKDIVIEYNIERECLKPIIRGKDIKPFCVTWNDMYVIYAVGKNFEARYPNAIAWLSRFKNVLQKRAAVYIWNREWYELEDPLSPEDFEVDKIVTPVATNINSFACDFTKYYCTEGVTILRYWKNEEEMKSYFSEWKRVNEPDLNVDEVINESNDLLKEIGTNKESLWFFVGILNSHVIEFIHKIRGQRIQKRTKRPKPGRYFMYAPPWLNVLPIEIPERSKRHEIIDRSKKISAICIRLNTTEDEKEKESLKEEMEHLLVELNEIVFEVYGLTKEEIGIIQSWVLKKR